jgi:hypothetical protein
MPSAVFETAIPATNKWLQAYAFNFTAIGISETLR